MAAPGAGAARALGLGLPKARGLSLVSPALSSAGWQRGWAVTAGRCLLCHSTSGLSLLSSTGASPPGVPFPTEKGEVTLSLVFCSVLYSAVCPDLGSWRYFLLR